MIIKMLTSATFTFAIGAAAQAMTIFPISATASSSYSSYEAFYAMDQVAGSSTSDWASLGQGASSTLSLDLGANYKLTSVALTDRVTSGGGNGEYVGGTGDFTTSFSLQAFTDATFTTTLGSSVIFTKSPSIDARGVADFAFSGNVPGLTARFVQYSVLASAGANPGLSDIVFQGSAVPEPAVWGLMLTGFAMTGFATRRRRSEMFAA